MTEQLSIAYRPIAELKAHPGNPRTHSPKQIRQIARSIEQFGFTNPILLDQEDRVLAGHGRLAAARLLGMAQVPTIRLAEMSEAQKRAYALADNRLAEAAGWDRELLALELRYISRARAGLRPRAHRLRDGRDRPPARSCAPARQDTLDRLPEADGPPVTAPGDLWCLGRHRVLCADATSAAAFERVMAGRAAQLVFTDPPYNVPIDGHVCGLGRTRHPDFAMAVGRDVRAEFTAFLATVLGHAAGHSADGALHLRLHGLAAPVELLTAGRAVYRELKNLCVWVKDNGGMGSLYRSQHELVLVFKNGSAPHINNVELGRHGRNRSNVWRYPGRQFAGRRAAGGAAPAPDGKAGAAGGRRDPGRLQAARCGARSLCSAAAPPCSPPSAPAGRLRARARAALRRRRDPPLAGSTPASAAVHAESGLDLRSTSPSTRAAAPTRGGRAPARQPGGGRRAR